MKILLISHARNDENAGASRVYHLLATALRAHGHEVSLRHYEDLRVPTFLNYLVLRALLPEFVYWRFFREAAECDVVFSSNGMAWRIFRELRARTQRPRLVHHLHGLNYFDHQAVVTEKMRDHVRLSSFFLALKSRFAIQWDARGAKYADVVVTQNLRDQDYLEDVKASIGEAFASQAPIFRIPCALHPQIEIASHDATPPEQRDPHAILWFGSWVERKGCHYVARAFAQVKEKYPAATLTLGGTGCTPGKVLAGFDPALRSSVRVLPRIDIAAQIREYNTHGIFIFPSISEGFGLSLLEAMAMGVACVTTATGMGADWTEDGEHALVVPMASADHLARGIIRLIGDAALRAHIARAGQKLACEFTVDRVAGEYLAVFEKPPAAWTS